MRYATGNEIDYLGTVGGAIPADARLVRELSRQLEALRRFDQHFSDADWRPRRQYGSRRDPMRGTYWPPIKQG